MATRQPTTDEICNGWLHNALDQILARHYDDLKIATAISLDAMLALRSERETPNPWIEKNKERRKSESRPMGLQPGPRNGTSPYL